MISSKRERGGLKELLAFGTYGVSDLVQLGSNDRVGRDSLEELGESLQQTEKRKEGGEGERSASEGEGEESEKEG